MTMTVTKTNVIPTTAATRTTPSSTTSINLVSYRGPNKDGGLSSAFGRAWNEYAHSGDAWWHVDSSNLLVSLHNYDREEAKTITKLPDNLVDGHYRYCNEFLWPVMHEFEQYASYVAEHRHQYEQLNSIVSQMLSQYNFLSRSDSGYFINDYQFALLPRLLKRDANNANSRCVTFWHVPWPRAISDQSYVSPLMEIARGLLGSETLGFQTKEYADNFMRFVQAYLPEFTCNWNNMSIKYIYGGGLALTNGYKEPFAHRLLHNASETHETTEIIIAPIGIDFNYWSSLASKDVDLTEYPLLNLPYILSVDRADYSKGVINRLAAINNFFERFPQWQEKVVFAQACGRTRSGLPAFDQYWDECQKLRAKIEQEWSTQEWQPLTWLPPSLPAEQLAKIYRNAAVMLVNPIRDGLNLTAKEYVACQNQKLLNAGNTDTGVLVLSPGAGAWHELGHYCIRIDPEQPQQMAEAINKALSLGVGEKAMRMSLLSEAVQNNSLAKWWYSFRNKLATVPSHSVSK